MNILDARRARSRSFKIRQPFDEMSALVLDSDLVYVGGGNTYKMMKLWRRLGLDAVLVEAASRGVVLVGSQCRCDLLV